MQDAGQAKWWCDGRIAGPLTPLQAKIQGLPSYMWDMAYQREHNAVIEGRDDNMNKFKPGVGAM